MNLRINLLPYRPARRLAKVNQLFMMWVGVVILGLVAAFMTDSALGDYIAGLQAKKVSQEATLKDLDKKLGEIKDLKAKKEQVKQRLELIATLSQSRDLTIRLLDAFSQTISEKMWLTKVTTRKSSLVLMGKAQSNAMVADFMRALEASPNISKVDLTQIARPTKAELDMKDFTITAQIGYPQPEPEVVSQGVVNSQPKRSKK